MIPTARGKTIRRTLRLTPEETAALTQAAGAMSLSENAYLRRALAITLRLDAFTSEPAPYQTWFQDGLRDLYAAANLAAVTGQALLALERERLTREARTRGVPGDLAQEETRLAIERAITEGRDALADPEVRYAFASLVPVGEPDETFWREADQGRDLPDTPPIEGE